MTKKRFGKYVSRVKHKPRPRLKKGGSVAAPTPGPGPAEGRASPEDRPEQDQEKEYLGRAPGPGEEADGEELLREVALEPLYAQHRALAINHGFRPAFAYRRPADIDLEAMARAIRDKHVRPTRQGHHSKKMAASGLHGKHLGGAIDWDMVGKKIGHASVFAGEVGLAASGVVGFINPGAGAAMAAVSAGSVGVGAAINHAYGENMLAL